MRHLADPPGLAEPNPRVREEITRIGRPVVEAVRIDVELDRAEAIPQRGAIAYGPRATLQVASMRNSPSVEHTILLGMVRILEEFGDPGPNWSAVSR